MWVLTVRSPWIEPRDYLLQPGKTLLGRNPDNDIVLADDLASRVHAEIEYDSAADHFTLRDLGSSNGTFLNRELVTAARVLQPDDQIRIGQHQLTLSQRQQAAAAAPGPKKISTRPLTRDLVLQSVDQHALMLYEVGVRLNTILDLDVALREVSQLARVALGADRCDVIPAGHFNDLARMGLPQTVARQAIDERQAVFIPDLSAELGRPPSSSALLLRIRSVLCVPGVVEDEVLALTYAYRLGPVARPFESQDLQLAVAVSHQAALTIQRDQLYTRARQFEQAAGYDELTGVQSRRSFVELAQAEFQRARRYQRPLSALVIDVDGMQRINTTHGAPAGDAALRAVADCCRENLRERHLVSRYGPDEFAVLLLECDLVMAQQVAERLRERVAALSIEAGGAAFSVTISTGCAAIADYSPDLATLLHQAETALYAARKESRTAG
jgi:diguanylate cyclase (GGDEF)-like protein